MWWVESSHMTCISQLHKFFSQNCSFYACFATSGTGKHIFLRKKISSAPLPQGTWFKTHYWNRTRRKKAQLPVGIKPMTSRVLLRRCELYCCETTPCQFHKLILRGNWTRSNSRGGWGCLDVRILALTQQPHVWFPAFPQENFSEVKLLMLLRLHWLEESG